MSEKRLKQIAALVGAALVVVVVAGALVGSRAAADDLEAQAERALAAADLDEVRVTFRGREAELSGGTAGDRGEAKQIVEGIDGVRWADVVPSSDAAASRPPDTTPTLDIRHTSDGIAIRGTVPDAHAAAGIKARVAEDFGVAVAGDLVIAPAVGGAPWIERLPGVFGDLVAVRGLELTVDGTGTLALSGSIESRAGAEHVRRSVAQAVPDLEVESRLQVSSRGLSEADGAVLNSTTLHFAPRRSTLTTKHRRQLDAVSAALRRHPEVAIETGAHAGPADPTAGEVLSLARVAAVKAYLVRSGIEVARISTRTFASDSRTAPPEAKQFRRVDFVVQDA